MRIFTLGKKQPSELSSTDEVKGRRDESLSDGGEFDNSNITQEHPNRSENTEVKPEDLKEVKNIEEDLSNRMLETKQYPQDEKEEDEYGFW